jgi:hypothetical protein
MLFLYASAQGSSLHSQFAQHRIESVDTLVHCLTNHLCSLLLFAGRPGRCFYRHLYLPGQAMFAALPADLGFGAYAEPPQQPVQLALLPDGTGFIKEGVEYRCVSISCYLTIFDLTQQSSHQVAVLDVPLVTLTIYSCSATRL